MKTVTVALEEMGLLEYKVIDDNHVLVYCDASLSGKINTALVTKGIAVNSVGVTRQDLEAYFVEKTGGLDHE